MEKERLERERLERERLERERLEQEQLERDRQERDRQDRLERERLERLERERQERERQEQLEREQLEWERERRISNTGKEFTHYSVFLIPGFGWWAMFGGVMYSNISHLRCLGLSTMIGNDEKYTAIATLTFSFYFSLYCFCCLET